MTITSGYTGSVAKYVEIGYTLNIGAGGFTQAAGTFDRWLGNGDYGIMTVNGPFVQTGGQFDAPWDLILYASDTFPGSLAFYNDGQSVTISPFSSTAVVSGNASFYQLYIGDGVTAGNVRLTIATGTTLTAQSSTYLNTYSGQPFLMGGGTLVLQGNLYNDFLPTLGMEVIPTSTLNIILNGSGDQVISDQGYSTAALPFYLPGLTINKTSGVVYDQSKYLDVASTTVQSGEFNLMSSSTASAQTFIASGTLFIDSSGVLSDYASVSSTIETGGIVNSNGEIFFDGSGGYCTASSSLNYITLRSVATGTQQWWQSGTGLFLMRYVSVRDQGGSQPIVDLNGTNVTGNNSEWTFPTGAVPELVQSTTYANGSGYLGGTNNLTFLHKPRAGDMILVAITGINAPILQPTDNMSNTYMLAASSTIGPTSTYTLALYYAKNIQTTSTLTATSYLDYGTTGAIAYEYTGIDPSSTFDTVSVNTQTVSSNFQTSLTATAASTNELYVGAVVLGPGASYPVAEAGWTPRAYVSNFGFEDMATSSPVSAAATWTTYASGTYAAILGIFHSPYLPGYSQGTLDSATFDTGVASGSQLN